MGLGDMADKAKDLAREHKDKVDEGIERGGDFIDEKTGGKYEEHVDKGQDAARDYLDDDTEDAEETEPRG